MLRPRATVAKIRMLVATEVYWSLLWVNGKLAAAAKAAPVVTGRCLTVSARSRAIRPDLVRAATARPVNSRQPVKSSPYSVSMPKVIAKRPSPKATTMIRTSAQEGSSRGAPSGRSILPRRSQLLARWPSWSSRTAPVAMAMPPARAVMTGATGWSSGMAWAPSQTRGAAGTSRKRRLSTIRSGTAVRRSRGRPRAPRTVSRPPAARTQPPGSRLARPPSSAEIEVTE